MPKKPKVVFTKEPDKLSQISKNRTYLAQKVQYLQQHSDESNSERIAQLHENQADAIMHYARNYVKENEQSGLITEAIIHYRQSIIECNNKPNKTDILLSIANATQNLMNAEADEILKKKHAMTVIDMFANNTNSNNNNNNQNESNLWKIDINAIENIHEKYDAHFMLAEAYKLIGNADKTAEHYQYLVKNFDEIVKRHNTLINDPREREKYGEYYNEDYINQYQEDYDKALVFLAEHEAKLKKRKLHDFKYLNDYKLNPIGKVINMQTSAVYMPLDKGVLSLGACPELKIDDLEKQYFELLKRGSLNIQPMHLTFMNSINTNNYPKALLKLNDQVASHQELSLEMKTHFVKARASLLGIKDLNTLEVRDERYKESITAINELIKALKISRSLVEIDFDNAASHRENNIILATNIAYLLQLSFQLKREDLENVRENEMQLMQQELNRLVEEEEPDEETLMRIRKGIIAPYKPVRDLIYDEYAKPANNNKDLNPLIKSKKDRQSYFNNMDNLKIAITSQILIDRFSDRQLDKLAKNFAALIMTSDANFKNTSYYLDHLHNQLQFKQAEHQFKKSLDKNVDGKVSKIRQHSFFKKYKQKIQQQHHPKKKFKSHP